MSEVWTNATLFFETEEITKEWAEAFSKLKDSLWESAQETLINKGCKSLKKEEKDGLYLSSVSQHKCRLYLLFMEGRVSSEDILKDLSKSGASHLEATIDYDQVGETVTLYKIGNRKVKFNKFIESVSKFDDHYAFVDAIGRGKLDKVNEILGKGIDANKELSKGWYPIHTAVSNNKAKIVKALLEAGADINVVTNNKTEWDYKKNRSPLFMAVFEKRIPMTKLLLKYKPNMDIRNGKGETALECAISE